MLPENRQDARQERFGARVIALDRIVGCEIRGGQGGAQIVLAERREIDLIGAREQLFGAGVFAKPVGERRGQALQRQRNLVRIALE